MDVIGLWFRYLYNRNVLRVEPRESSSNVQMCQINQTAKGSACYRRDCIESQLTRQKEEGVRTHSQVPYPKTYR